MMALALLAGLMLAAEPTTAPPASFVPPGHELAFAAEFDDDTETFARTGNPRFTTGQFRLHGQNDLNVTRRLAANGERQLYVDRDFTFSGQRLGIDPFTIHAGVLRLTATRLTLEQQQLLAPLTRGHAKPVQYASGLLSTETEGRPDGCGYVQLHGYWEMRAKLPRGKGLWPAFWLVTQTHDYWDEVDIFEVLGHQPEVIFHTTHFHDGGGTEGMPWRKRSYRKVDTSDGFHTYGLQITDDQLRFTVDGQLTLRASHTLETPLYTIVNLAVGGKWPGHPDEHTGFPATMEIDYLRIYRRVEPAGGVNP